jgi:hypothetical protein
VPLPNPIYIGENALHQPSAIRLLSYGLTTGKPGVLGTTDCAIKALGTPGAAIQAMPGAYMVRNKALGGSYEGYAGKFDVAEQKAVSAVGSGGSRRDLVVLVIKDPYVSGAGAWDEPGDLVDGPYAHIEVIENVGTTVWDVSQAGAPYNTWSAITLARIDRDPSTGIVTQGDITDLRSLAALGGTRTVIVDAPDPPPIAQQSYVQFKESAGDPNYGNPVGGSDTVHDYLVADTATKNWPAAATFQVPVPEWAVECDVEFQVFNAQIITDDVYGKMWVDFGGTATTFQTYAIEYVAQPGRWVVAYGKTITVPSALRGKVITVRTKFASYYTTTGKLDAKSGTTTKLSLNFQRVPD